MRLCNKISTGPEIGPVDLPMKSENPIQLVTFCYQLNLGEALLFLHAIVYL